jgi:predicted O-methyltransferase YrrM
MMPQQLPDALVDIFKRGLVLDSSGVERPLDSNISEAEAGELFATVLRLAPRNSLEVGLADGISALAIVGAIKQNGFGHHHIIDPFQRNYGYVGKLNIERNGYSTISSFYERFPEEVIPQLPNLQFAFVDASHLFDFTLMEFVLIDKKLEVGGIIGLHDLWMPAIRAVIRYVLANRAYEIAIDLISRPSVVPVSRKLKQLGSRILSFLPQAERIFRTEVLKPWASSGLANMIFLRKFSHDRRDWRFHRTF